MNAARAWSVSAAPLRAISYEHSLEDSFGLLRQKPQ
jgi:hypothetical protein